MMNGEAQAAQPLTSPNCASYLRKWNRTTKNCCCTWPKKSQEPSPSRPANFIQQPQVRRLLTRVSGFPRTAPSSIVQAAAYMKYPISLANTCKQRLPYRAHSWTFDCSPVFSWWRRSWGGLILGYGGVDPRQIQDGIQRLRIS